MSEKFIVLPKHGLKASPSDGSGYSLLIDSAHALKTASFNQDIVRPITMGGVQADIQVLDSIHEDGPKLIEADPSAAARLEDTEIGLRVVPLISYRVALGNQFKPDPVPGAQSSQVVTVEVHSAQGVPISDALVTAFTDFDANLGAESITNANGQAYLALGNVPIQVERLYVQPPLAGFWGAFGSNAVVQLTHRIQLNAVDLNVPDVLRHLLSPAMPGDGDGVIVAVVDTGIGPHNDLVVDSAFSCNTAKGEARNMWDDNGTGHGTHVAGIIAARGNAPAGLSGLAPQVLLRSYRAFSTFSQQTTNYQLMKAIMYAVDGGCHIVNLSVAGENRPDTTLDEALEDARDRGVLVVAAAGNGAHKPVSIPAHYAYRTGLSVSAMGRLGTFPAGSFEASHLDTPRGVPDADNFFARFSNLGNVSVTGPGVGILSTVPGGYGPMSGTSMACPAVTGIAARIFARDLRQNGPLAVLNMPPDKARSLRMISLVSSAARRLGFGQSYEGYGLVQ